jgi:hypothetical protein
MLEVRRMFGLLVALVLDFLFIAVWLLLSWLVHHYLIVIFSLEGSQGYKFIVIESAVDFAVCVRLYKFLFLKAERKPQHTPWWY